MIERTPPIGSGDAALREIVRANIEDLWTAGDASLIPVLYSPDVVDHN